MLWTSRTERIARVADRWAARSAGRPTAAEIAERDAWRAEAPEHEAAWQRAQSLMTMTQGMRRPSAAPASGARRGFNPAYALAGVAAIVAAGGTALTLERRLGSAVATAGVEYAAASHPEHIRLADGSMIDLLPGSTVRADYAGPVRAILVERGTARFDVAHDASRPFVVSAGDRKVTAIGTRFEVALRPRGVMVTLYQGAIEVAAQTHGEADKPVRLKRGQRLTVTDGKPETSIVPARDPSTVGAHDVDPTSAADIVTQANRHAEIPVRFASPDLGARKVEGRFDTRDTAALSEQLGAALGLDVRRIDGAYLLTRH